MSFNAAVSGFVIFLLCAAVVQSQNDWGVTYSSTKICALKGSTVEIRCTYTHPTTINNLKTTVRETLWFIHANDEAVDLKLKAEYAGRYDEDDCKLIISDLRESDSAEYQFRFITNQPGGSFTGSPGVFLTVSGPDTNMKITKQSYKGESYLWCYSRCLLPGSPTYVWYKNGKRMSEEKSTYSDNFQTEDSVSCAVKGHEDFPSSTICVNGQYCNKVIYNQRRICAVKGSSVNIACVYRVYSNYYKINSKFWYNPGRSHRWRIHSQPEDLQSDPQYSDRVQVSDREGDSSLTIHNLTERDSAEYRFKFKKYLFEWGSDAHGITLTVTALQVQVTRISTHHNVTLAQLKCHSICSPADHHSFIWFKNGHKISESANSYRNFIYLGDQISCAVNKGEHRAPAVYAPNSPSVSVSPPGEIMVGHSVKVSCISNANPAANYSWYKKNSPAALQPPSKDPQLVFSSIKPSDSGEYYCAAENELGRTTSGYTLIDVNYAPKLPSVSVNPSGEIEEGISVTLTCISDSNPASTYTWHKENQTLHQVKEGIYHFTPISRNDRGLYLCTSENKYGQENSSSVHIDVQYAPDVPSLSVSPSGELMEGASVNLTCSSDASPAANYTWYKENEDSPKLSGQTFIITDIRSEHGGIYYCKAQNGRGYKKSKLHSIIVLSSKKSAVVGSVSVIFLAFILSICIVIGVQFRRKRSSKKNSQSRERPDSNVQQNVAPEGDASTAAFGQLEEDDINYASVRFRKKQDDALYSNIMQAQLKRHKDEYEEEEDGEYTIISLIPAPPGLGRQSAAEETSAVYSTVNTNHRV